MISQDQLAVLAARYIAAEKASGKSRAAIAAEARTRKETLSRLSHAKEPNPGADLLIRIAATLETTVSYLLGESIDELTPDDRHELLCHREWINGKLPKIDRRAVTSASLLGQLRTEVEA